MERIISIGPTGIFGISFEAGPPWLVWLFQLVGPKWPFPFDKMLSPVPLFCILLTRTITKRAVAWVGTGQPECTVPLGKWNFRNFEPEFLLNGKRPRLPFSDFQRHFEHVMNKESVGKSWHRVEYRWQGLVEVYNSWQRLVSGSESYKT